MPAPVPTCQEYHRSVQEADQERDQGLAQKIDREYLDNLELKRAGTCGLVFFKRKVLVPPKDLIYQ